jgi:hypothetical protein
MILLSGRVPGRASRPSRSRNDDDGGLQYVLWKRVRPLRGFSLKGIYRRKGDIRGGPGVHTTWWCGQGVARATLWCGCPLAPPPSLLWTPSSYQVNRNFGFCFVQFREYFLCNFSETQKQQKTGTGTVASR